MRIKTTHDTTGGLDNLDPIVRPVRDAVNFRRWTASRRRRRRRRSKCLNHERAQQRATRFE